MDVLQRAIHDVAIGTVQAVGFSKNHAFGMMPALIDRWCGLYIEQNFGLYSRGCRLVSMSMALPVRSHNGISVSADLLLRK